MRRRLLTPVAFAQTPPASSGAFAIESFRAWRLREPDSGRRYSVIRITSQTGVSGYGEGGPIKSAEFAEARNALTGRRATALEFVRHQFAGTPALEAALVRLASCSWVPVLRQRSRRLGSTRRSGLPVPCI
jgi:hypothetical protein